MNELRSNPKNIKDMTLEEEQEFIDKMNEDLRWYIEIAPNVEIGDVPDGHSRKLRAIINEGTYSMAEIVFELQYNLWQRQKTHPDTTRLTISELTLTSQIPNTAWVRGVMITMKYEER